MEDYQISPEIVAGCAEEIRTKCNGGVHREGKTLHCLMDLAKPKPVNHKMQVEISDICQREVRVLINCFVRISFSWGLGIILLMTCIVRL